MKGVGIAELKARLSEHLKTVRKGRSVTVLDRDTPIAKIIPYESESVEVRRATKHPRELSLPKPLRERTNSLAALLEDRRRR